jgi:hypothetical protein
MMSRHCGNCGVGKQLALLDSQLCVPCQRRWQLLLQGPQARLSAGSCRNPTGQVPEQCWREPGCARPLPLHVGQLQRFAGEKLGMNLPLTLVISALLDPQICPGLLCACANVRSLLLLCRSL